MALEYGIAYYDTLMQEEQTRLTASIRLLLHQTFILERKFDRRSGRFQYNPDFRDCNKHLEFIRSYFAVSGIEVMENTQTGIIYIQGENLMGDKLPKLATLYLDRKSTRLNSSHARLSRMPSSA